MQVCERSYRGCIRDRDSFRRVVELSFLSLQRFIKTLCDVASLNPFFIFLTENLFQGIYTSVEYARSVIFVQPVYILYSILQNTLCTMRAQTGQTGF